MSQCPIDVSAFHQVWWLNHAKSLCLTLQLRILDIFGWHFGCFNSYFWVVKSPFLPLKSSNDQCYRFFIGSIHIFQHKKWIGLWENLQETMYFPMKYGGFRFQFSCKPILLHMFWWFKLWDWFRYHRKTGKPYISEEHLIFHGKKLKPWFPLGFL